MVCIGMAPLEQCAHVLPHAAKAQLKVWEALTTTALQHSLPSLAVALPTHRALHLSKFHGGTERCHTTIVQHLGHAFDRGVAKPPTTLACGLAGNDQAVDDLKSILVRTF